MTYSAGTIAISGAAVAGTGTNFTAAANQVRAGQTLLVLTSPPQIFEIATVNSATSLTLTAAANPVIPAGTRYAILTTDALSVDGLAQSIAQLVKDYDANSAAWEAFAGTTANQTVTVSINGVSVTIPALGKLAVRATNGAVPVSQGGTGATTQAMALAALLGSSAVPVANGGTGATTAAEARRGLGLEYGTTAGTVAQGNDTRLGTVNGKSGGSITGTVEAVIASAEPAFKSPLAATFQQGPNQFRNVLSHIVLASPDQVMIHDAYGDSTTIQARTIVQSASGVFKIYTYDHQGNATAPGSWVNNSDERLKTNIARVSEPLKKMRMLRGVTWDRVDGVQSGQGFIAQELKRVFPTAVFNSGEKLLPNGELLSDVLSVDLAGAAAALHHEAILALMDKNEAQQAEIAALKSDLEDLKKIVDQLIAQ
ncbi:tail fiber domain-containing protein [Atlantibacter hermannii]|uniref:tail fiber domain-containing protein n=1 Tax=Atlantibacter hermannii TaxID=565 RepID=UPI0028A23E4F|nr:tail fiber domain-containing protein [Atlantibacter hermannii]